MKLFVTATLLFLFSFQISAQQLYSRAKIWAKTNELQTLMELGLAIDHAHIKENTFVISDFSSAQLQKVRNAGFQVDVLIKDVKNYYANRADKAITKNGGCSNNEEYTYEPQVPTHFQLGSMAGYYTYQEFLDELDQMATEYPQLISSRAPVSDTLSHEGRPIYYVKMSNDPSIDQQKPRVLYSSVHHAREPGSLSEVIFYMWHLLENYGTDPEATYLIDELELFFVPMINPDGYIENETTNPNGGGLFRKNKNPNFSTLNPGVDLNRNYSYQWNTTGVSPDPSHDTFAGMSAFSEPETKNMKKIAEDWDISFAMNAHTYSGLMLYPYGATVNDFAADDSYFNTFSSEMVRYSGYINQKSSSLYPASGDSDDYMYNDHGIFAVTPEVSYNGFYSPPAQIIKDCKDMLYSNLVFAHLPLVYGVTKNLDASTTIDNVTGNFNHEIQRLGQEAGTLTVSIAPLVGIQSVGNNIDYNLQLEEIQTGAISYQLNPSIQYGDEITYVLVTDNGDWQKRDTISKTYGSATLQFNDEANNLNNWTGDWGISNVEYFSSDQSFTDSPNSPYQSNSYKVFNLKDTIDLENTTAAAVSYYAKWEIENNYDFVQFQISTDDGSTWIPQCGKLTNNGVGGQNGGQPVNEPLYDGLQSDWALEEINLSEYLGEKINMRFILQSDAYVNDDGFYFDDFKILYDKDSTQGVNTFSNEEFKLFPNPANDHVTISFNQYIEGGEVSICNATGQKVYSKTIQSSTNKIELNVFDLDQGVYFVRIKQQNVISQPKRFVIVK